MNAFTPANSPVVVIGAGIMGTGIAQIAAQAGHPVTLLDNRVGAAHQAREKLAATLQRLRQKGKFDAAGVQSILGRIRVADHIEAVSGATLVVEAIVEDADAKRALLREIEARVAPDCILASNTSSLSITRLAGGLTHPQRVVGMHFFNPVPVMRLVEVVTGLQTDPAVAEATGALARAWGKTPVHAKSTPGFIVNRIARPYYAEGLALLQENALSPAQLDGCLRAAGFRMGPCELMDLIGHDTNFAVTRSVYEANFYDKRYVPSLVQRQLVDGGLLGRKAGRGFYAYDDSMPNAGVPPMPTPIPVPAPRHRELQLTGSGKIAERMAAALDQAGMRYTRNDRVDWTGLLIDGVKQVRLTDGHTATALGHDAAVFDLPIESGPGSALAMSVSLHAQSGWRGEATAWLQTLGFSPVVVGDTPGLVVARTLAMLINEAADAVQQDVCSQDDADTAMKLGVNYPAGPFQWLKELGASRIVTLLDALDQHYRGERYRVSPWLRQRS